MTKQVNLQEALNFIELITSSGEFETGIDFIDEQDLMLVQFMSELTRSIVLKSDPLSFENALNDLSAYAIAHFETEEDLMRQFISGDELELKHQLAHQEFLQKIDRLKGQSSRPLNDAIKDLLAFLSHWLAFHILDSDRRMAKVVLAIQAGIPLEEAKVQADREISGALKVLVHSVLVMYDKLSSRTLQLMKEIVEGREAGKQQLHEHAYRQNIIESLPGIFYTFDASGQFHAWNKALEEVSGRSADEIKKAHPLDFFDIEDKSQVATAIQQVFTSGRVTVEANLLDKSGKRIPYFFTGTLANLDQGPVVIGLGIDISDRIRAEKQVQHLAYFDSLTGLPNRRMLSDRLTNALSQAKRHKRPLAIMFLDLDNFKTINDTYGHNIGDELLKEVSLRLTSCIRSGDTVARQGGDEFIIVLAEIARSEDAASVAEKIIQALSDSVCVADFSFRVTTSVGIAVYSPNGDEGAQDLLINADKAMYAAKAAGRNGYQFFSKD